MCYRGPSVPSIPSLGQCTAVLGTADRSVLRFRFNQHLEFLEDGALPEGAGMGGKTPKVEQSVARRERRRPPAVDLEGVPSRRRPGGLWFGVGAGAALGRTEECAHGLRI